MQRKTLLGFALLLAACACHAPTAMEVVLVTVPMAPLGETAPAAPLGETAPAAPLGPVTYARTEVMRHDYTDARGRTMRVAVQFTYCATDAGAATAAERVRSCWQEAVAHARGVLQRADLTTEAGTIECEAQLCGVLNETLFPDDDGNRLATIDRVLWKRVTWS
ncbi:MAG: hypothetical protein FJ265_20095 [Planctomycetes bacterium]|nr:hypothetical protein [Planctomycetota bacterium]